jgi:hypothetical protein
MAVSLGLGIALVIAWFAAATDIVDPSVVLSLTVVATLLLPGETGTTNQVLLLLPILAWLSVWRRRRWLVGLVTSVLLVAPWALFLLTIQGDLEHPMMILPLPLCTLILILVKARNDVVDEPLLVR